MESTVLRALKVRIFFCKRFVAKKKTRDKKKEDAKLKIYGEKVLLNYIYIS